MPDTGPDRVVCVVGLGYVGLPLAVALAETGTAVVGLDADPARVVSLAAGQAGIEDVSDERLLAALDAGLRLTSRPQDAAGATAYLLCVPTPLREGGPDLRHVEAAGRTVAGLLAPGDLVVLESTTYPGTTEDVLVPLLAASGLAVGTDVDVAYSPERIDPGNPVWRLETTPKIVGGMTPAATVRARELYARVVPSVVSVAGPREAEMAKLLENTYRHVNIALVNEMAVFCHELDIDLWSVIRAAATKPFGFQPFWPGPGVGGHCIPVDPSYLSWTVRGLGYQFRFVELAQEVNARMPSYVVARAMDLLNDAGLALSRARVLCLGLTYKADIADVRESPAIRVAELLAHRGADVGFCDPHLPAVSLGGRSVPASPLSASELDAADLVVMLTAHRAFDLELVRRHARLVLDTRDAVGRGPGVHPL